MNKQTAAERNAARRARNAEISATLTATPQWVAEWGEYAAKDSRGWVCTASTEKFVAEMIAENERIIARHAMTNGQVAQ